MKQRPYTVSSALVLLALLSLVAFEAMAFSVRVAGGNPVRWAEPYIPFYIQYAGSDNLTSEVSLQAVTNGFELSLIHI